jgi:HSP20 family molecular chaperone IbpA
MTKQPTTLEKLYRDFAPSAFQHNVKMSPFSQFGSLPGVGGYGGGIDRDFSPVLNYLDEFDRHFSRRHRFVNCFIPRFDLEEDAHNYYLYGDIPGATIDAITIEAHTNHTLQIYGKTLRLGVALSQQDQEPEVSTAGSDFVHVPISNHNTKESSFQPPPLPPPSDATNATTNPAPIQGQAPYFPPPPTQQQVTQNHPHHERHKTFSGTNAPREQTHHILLSERLVGDFHRTFAFPSPVVEDGVKASLENGVLSLVVPKKDAGSEERRGRRVPIERGRSYGGN